MKMARLAYRLVCGCTVHYDSKMEYDDVIESMSKHINNCKKAKCANCGKKLDCEVFYAPPLYCKKCYKMKVLDKDFTKEDLIKIRDREKRLFNKLKVKCKYLKGCRYEYSVMCDMCGHNKFAKGF